MKHPVKGDVFRDAKPPGVMRTAGTGMNAPVDTAGDAWSDDHRALAEPKQAWERETCEVGIVLTGKSLS